MLRSLRWWNVDTFLQVLRAFRVCWFKGRFAGGKSLLSIAIAREFLVRGWSRYFITNIGSVWADDFEDVVPNENLLDVFLVMDEAGQFLKSSAQLDAFIAYARMLNITLIMPSVMPVAMRARFLSVIRVF